MESDKGNDGVDISEEVKEEVVANEPELNESPVEVVTEEVPPPTSEFPIPVPAPAVPKKGHKKLLLIILIAILLIGGGAGAFFYLSKKSSDKKKVDTKNSVATTQTETKSPVLTTGYQWPAVEKVATLPAFTDTATFFKDYDSKDEIAYYKIGSSKTTTIYVVIFPRADGPGGDDQELVIAQTGPSFTVLQKHSPDFFYKTAIDTTDKYQGPTLGQNTTIDATTEISDIKVPATLTYNTQKLAPVSTLPRFIVGTLDPSDIKVASLPEGTLYEIVNKDEVDYKITHFGLLMKGNFFINLKIDGELSKADVEPITWSDGKKNTVDYISGAQGCGLATSNEVAKITVDKLKQIGTTAGGQKIYGFASTSNTLLKKHYDEYVPIKNDTYIDADYRNLSIDQYAAKPALFLVEDGLGRFLVFESSKTRFEGGCAKPVVYLYPTVPTLTHVSVGADVTLSEPHYTSTGWDNVLAMPNGKLGYDGKQYDSLFWEGYGHGEYPSVAEGTVVERSQVNATMSVQLHQLGLNDKETSDFMAFWGSKVPNKPYVRLSWLGTQAMEKLAPLYVSPLPDTRIRVFLDMEGMDSFIKLPAQHLFSVKRQGFTVVEWGGLARDGSVPSLR